MHTDQELFSEYPKILEIARRLENSESNAIKETEQYRAKGKDTEKHPDHYQFKAYYRDTIRHELDLGLQSGKTDFLETIKWIIETHDPDAIALTLHNGKPSRINNKRNILIAITEEGEKVRENDSANEALDGIRKVKLGREENTGSDNTDFKLQLMQKDYDYKLEKINLEKKYEKELAAKEQEIKDLQSLVQKKDDEIKDLKENLDDKDGELGSLTEEMEYQQDPPTIEIFSKVAQRTLTGILQAQPKLTSAITGLTEDELKTIWLNETKQIEAPQLNAAASFEDSIESGYEGKSPEHVHAIQTIHQFCKQIPLDAFQKLVSIFTAISTETGDFDHKIADKLLAIIYRLQKQQEEEQQEKPKEILTKTTENDTLQQTIAV